ncbi:MAG: dTDP-4-dehydrorhamnose 3,5-epimerase [Bacteroidia bacterium]
MQLTEELLLKGLILIRPQVYHDSRGYFFESYNQEKMLGRDFKETFVQDNESLSNAGVLRGLHFQNPPYAQGKLVRVVKGAVMDVVVDIRKSSPTYKEHYAVELNEENKWMLYIPPGFAHGFITLKDDTIFQYKCTNYWNKASESGIRWNDEQLNINWKTAQPVLSEKDSELPLISDALNLFV